MVSASREVGLPVPELEGTDGTEEHRPGQRPAEQLDGGVTAADVAQHPGDDGPRVEGRAIGPLGDLVAGAARHVGVGARVQRLLRARLERTGGDRHAGAVAVDPGAVDLVLAAASCACSCTVVPR